MYYISEQLDFTVIDLLYIRLWLGLEINQICLCELSSFFKNRLFFIDYFLPQFPNFGSNRFPLTFKAYQISTSFIDDFTNRQQCSTIFGGKVLVSWSKNPMRNCQLGKYFFYISNLNAVCYMSLICLQLCPVNMHMDSYTTT